MTVPLRSLESSLSSLERLDIIDRYAIDCRLRHDLIEVRRLDCSEQPVIRIAHDKIGTFLRWVEPLADATVTVGRDQSGFVGRGVIPSKDPAFALPVLVVMTVHPGPIRAAGLVGEITVDDLGVLVGQLVSA